MLVRDDLARTVVYVFFLKVGTDVSVLKTLKVATVRHQVGCVFLVGPLIIGCLSFHLYSQYY